MYQEFLDKMHERHKWGGLMALFGQMGANLSILGRYVRKHFVPVFAFHSSCIEEWILNATGYRLNGLKDVFKFEGKEY